MYACVTIYRKEHYLYINTIMTIDDTSVNVLKGWFVYRN